MSDQFVAEIRIFPFNFPPRGWAFCDGQILPISQNTALFSLLGTTYGGNGSSNFALPDMQGNAPMQPGQGQGLSLRDLGEMSGSPNVTLLQTEMPAHNHNAGVSQADGIDQTPANSQLATGVGIGQYVAAGPSLQLANNVLAPYGGGLPHNNMQPYLTLSFCIALQGIFPQRP
jgi:microcystin-dependent protein